MLREKLTTLKKDLIEYATLVERMIEDSVKGLLQRDSQLLEDVIEKEEPEANEWEMQLDDLCTNLIARYQPKAKDLRVILMVLKIHHPLTREQTLTNR